MRRPDGEPMVDLEGVCNANELLIVDSENKRRAQNRTEQQARERGRKGRRR